MENERMREASKLDEGCLELKSEDGVIFRVEEYHLKASSNVFRDMLSVNDVEPARKRPRWSTRGEIDGSSLEQRPIDIPAQSVFVKYFVELVTQAPLSPKKVDSLLPKHHRFHNRPIRCMKFMEEELLDRFDCTPAMYDRLHLHFEPEYRSHSWAVFLIAAKHKDVEMARKAIQHFRWLQGEKKVDPNTMPLADAESIPLSWFLGYSRAYASAMEDHPDALDDDKDLVA